MSKEKMETAANMANVAFPVLGEIIKSILPFILLVIVAVFVWHFSRRPKGAPPGPIGWPIIGSLLSLGDDPGGYMKSLSAKYGKVVGLFLGTEFVVVINDIETAKEAYLKHGEIFSGRDVSGTLEYAAQGFFNRSTNLYQGKKSIRKEPKCIMNKNYKTENNQYEIAEIAEEEGIHTTNIYCSL